MAAPLLKGPPPCPAPRSQRPRAGPTPASGGTIVLGPRSGGAESEVASAVPMATRSRAETCAFGCPYLSEFLGSSSPARLFLLLQHGCGRVTEPGLPH